MILELKEYMLEVNIWIRHSQDMAFWAEIV